MKTLRLLLLFSTGRSYFIPQAFVVIKMNDVKTQMALRSQVIISSSLLPHLGGQGSSLQIILLLLFTRIESQNGNTPSFTKFSSMVIIDPILSEMQLFKDGAYYCYCAYVLRILRYSDFLSVMLTNTGILLRGLKLPGESRS